MIIPAFLKYFKVCSDLHFSAAEVKHKIVKRLLTQKRQASVYNDHHEKCPRKVNKNKTTKFVKTAILNYTIAVPFSLCAWFKTPYKYIG